jgi:hypothetical protein
MCTHVSKCKNNTCGTTPGMGEWEREMKKNDRGGEFIYI